MGNINRNKHAMILGANHPITGRSAQNYKGSPLMGYFPTPFMPEGKTIFCVDFTTGAPKDIGPHVFPVIESGNPDYQANSPFNGLSLYVPVGSTDNICYLDKDDRFLVSYPITVEAWVWLDVAGASTQRIFSNTEVGNIDFQINSSGYPTFNIYTSASQTIVSTILAETKKWFYVAGIYDGINQKIYHRNTMDSAARNGKITAANQDMAFGVEPQGYPTTTFIDPLQGYLAGAHMIRRAKSQAEIEKYLVGV